MGGVATLSLLIPSAAKLGGHTGYPYYLVIIRVLMGLCEAATFPCITSMLARWAPEQERATMSTFIMAGSQVKEDIVMHDWRPLVSGRDYCWLLHMRHHIGCMGMGECFLYQRWILFCVVAAVDYARC